MARHNADTDSLREAGGAERDTIVACSSLFAVSIVLVVGCALCVNKRRPTADIPLELEARPNVYDDVNILPESDPFTDSDGYTIPFDCFPEAKQESKIPPEKVKVQRSLQSDKEVVFVTNLGTMTKISLSSERLNTNNSWTFDTKGGILQKDKTCGSISSPSTVVNFPQDNTEKTKKSSRGKGKGHKFNDKDQISSTNVDFPRVSVQTGKLGNRLPQMKVPYENVFV